MNVRESFLFWLISIAAQYHTLGFIPNQCNYTIFEKLTVTLYNDVKFMAERLDQINTDAVFGLTLTQANLAVVLSNRIHAELMLESEWNRLVQTHQLCHKSRVFTVKKLLQKKNDPFNALITILMRPEIWMKKILWRKGVVQTLSSTCFNSATANVTDFFFSGTPQDIESDYCLIQLANDNCSVSDICADMLMRNDDSRGYPLTHRLLFVEIALSRNCQRHPLINYSILIEQYCNQILQDLINLENANFPSISHDLAMEQIQLCGMEGYLEFITAHYANLIINWQSLYGCYSAFTNNHQTSQLRRKKSTNIMDYGCDSHASGVAAAALSLLIRGYIENCSKSINKHKQLFEKYKWSIYICTNVI